MANQKFQKLCDYYRNHPFKSFIYSLFAVFFVLQFFMSTFAYMDNNPKFWYLKMAATKKISIDSIYKLKREMEFRQYIVDSILDKNKNDSVAQSDTHQRPE